MGATARTAEHSAHPEEGRATSGSPPFRVRRAPAARITELEALSATRVADLVAPGQVILKLARRGFGVLLSGA
jgi:hypothetical protein